MNVVKKVVAALWLLVPRSKSKGPPRTKNPDEVVGDEEEEPGLRSLCLIPIQKVANMLTIVKMMMTCHQVTMKVTTKTKN
jgi:hypothetical protein